MNKKVVLVLNKWDLLNDDEILKEYKKTLFSELNTFLKNKKYGKISDDVLEKNTFLTSA
ncbi:hypothetical protein IJU97_05355 [bacterium]|nr:hypothetical protein [bacterium]